jgi:hypothetical protein
LHIYFITQADRVNRLNKAVSDIYSATSPSDEEDDTPNYGYIALLISYIMSFEEKLRYQSGENISDIISQ